jgi:hypothetical protein
MRALLVPKSFATTVGGIQANISVNCFIAPALSRPFNVEYLGSFIWRRSGKVINKKEGINVPSLSPKKFNQLANDLKSTDCICTLCPRRDYYPIKLLLVDLHLFSLKLEPVLAFNAYIYFDT